MLVVGGDAFFLISVDDSRAVEVFMGAAADAGLLRFRRDSSSW